MTPIPTTTLHHITLVHGRREHFPPVRPVPPIAHCSDQGRLMAGITASLSTSGSKRRREEDLSNEEPNPRRRRYETVAEIEENGSSMVPPFAVSVSLAQPYHRSEMTKVVAAWTRFRSRPPLVSLYECGHPLPIEEENSHRTYHSKQEQESWQHRIDMFSKAMGTGELGEPYNNVFCLSVIPRNPQVSQTLYYKHSFIDDSRAANNGALAYISGLVNNLDVPFFAPRAPILRGFLHPYNGFSSNLFSSDIDLAALPPSISRIPLDSEIDLQDATLDIEPTALRELVKSIGLSFLHDVHSLAMFIVILQPAHAAEGPLKKILFVKS